VFLLCFLIVKMDCLRYFRLNLKLGNWLHLQIRVHYAFLFLFCMCLFFVFRHLRFLMKLLNFLMSLKLLMILIYHFTFHWKNFYLGLEEEVSQQGNLVKVRSIFVIFASQIIIVMNLDWLYRRFSRMNFIPFLNQTLFLKYLNVLFDSWFWVLNVIYLNQLQVLFIQLLAEIIQLAQKLLVFKFIQLLLSLRYLYFNNLFPQNIRVN